MSTFQYFWTSLVGHCPKDLMYILFGHYTIDSLSTLFQVRVPIYHSTQGGETTWSNLKIMLVVAQGIIFVTATSLLVILGRRTMKKLEEEAEEGEELG
jgi:hypothetical protein